MLFSGYPLSCLVSCVLVFIAFICQILADHEIISISCCVGIHVGVLIHTNFLGPSYPWALVRIEVGQSSHFPPIIDFIMQWSLSPLSNLKCPFKAAHWLYLVCCRVCVTVELVLKESPTVSTWWRKPRALWSTCQLNPTPWAKPFVCWFNTDVSLPGD